MVDVRLMMGARASGDSMSTCISVVRDVLAQRYGIFSECYIDDFIFVCYADEAPAQLAVARDLWESLGWQLNPTKFAAEGAPTTSKVFLGLLFNTVDMTVSVDVDRRRKLTREIDDLLSGVTTPSPRVYARLAGRLSFTSTVVPYGRVFCRSLYPRSSDESPRWVEEEAEPVPGGIHPHVLADLRWWRDVLVTDSLAATASFGRPAEGPANLPPVVHVYTDASGHGWGAVFPERGEWISGPWTREERSSSSTAMWEAMAILFAAATWGRLATGGYLVVHSDSMACVRGFTHLRCANERMYMTLRVLSVMQMRGGYRLLYEHIPGVLNVTADALSREPKPPPHLLAACRRYFPAAARSLGASILTASRHRPSLVEPWQLLPSTTGSDTAFVSGTQFPRLLQWTPWSAPPSVMTDARWPCHTAV